MRVLITGGAGFIGSHLSDRLLERGDDVLVIDNLLTGKAANVAGELIERDITDKAAFVIDSVAFDPDLILHCAASYSDPDKKWRDVCTNVLGALNVAEVADRCQAKVVYPQTLLPPVSSYAISKIAGEEYLHSSGIDLLVVRLANVYGPRNLSGPIPTFTRKILAGEVCTITHTARDFVYVDTLVDTVLDAIENRAWGGFDDMVIHSGRDTHIRTVYELIAAELDDDGHRFQEIPAPPDDIARMDFQGAAPVLDCSLSFGIRQTVDWYREHGVGETYTHLRVGT